MKSTVVLFLLGQLLSFSASAARTYLDGFDMSGGLRVNEDILLTDSGNAAVSISLPILSAGNGISFYYSLHIAPGHGGLIQAGSIFENGSYEYQESGRRVVATFRNTQNPNQKLRLVIITSDFKSMHAVSNGTDEKLIAEAFERGYGKLLTVNPKPKCVRTGIRCLPVQAKQEHVRTL